MNNNVKLIYRIIGVLSGPLIGWIPAFGIAFALTFIAHDTYYFLGFPGTGQRPWVMGRIYLFEFIYAYIFVCFGAFFAIDKIRLKVSLALFLIGFCIILPVFLNTNAWCFAGFYPLLGGLLGVFSVFVFSKYKKY